MSELINVFQDRKGELFRAFLEHIQISFLALFFALLIAIPLGIYLTRKPKAAEPIIGIAAVLQTVPSLALLGLLIPLVGIGTVPAIIALVVYALLPILRNTYTGIKEIEPSLLEAASAMGMNQRKSLLRVELPLAMPVIMAGIRTATVLIIGTATMAALIGAGGLGDLILLGIDRNDTSLIVIGAIPAALLAVLFDVLLRLLEKVSFKKALGTVTAMAIVVVLMVTLPLIGGNKENQLVIAGKMGTEPEILINMYKLLIEKNTDLTVSLQPNLGGTSFVYNALQSGSIDIYPEFTGTAIAEFLKEAPVSTDSKEVYEQARKGMTKLKMALLEPMQYNNTYALAVPRSFAEKYQIKTISDLAHVQHLIKAGFTREFTDREDGYPGLMKVYGFKFPSVTTMEPKLRYNAVKNGEINLVDAYSTDSELKQYQLTVLEDDKHFFPPYQGAPLLRQETVEKYPQLIMALNKLGGRITDNEMRSLNYSVAVKGKSAEEVAKEFLLKNGLL
ncbi:ABC transporter permease/substrate-binding protein [Paenibacillus kribbensis]|uniref:ABC transporter permease/substrate-binding protein n=1 Tax=Paenibacillus kribbensis TaxID=172713 RepID=UPI000837B084|nr:ABC transporter permease/substrate-binding protein [Paenibacillus kribbensis]